MNRTRMSYVVAIIICGLAQTTDVHARTIVFGKAKETIPVAYGVESILRFPLEVKTVTEAARFEIRPANAEEPDYSILMVKPRFSDGAADVSFILSDGTVIRTQLVISNRPNLKKDSIYDFKQKSDLDQTNPNLPEKYDPMVISELDLMRGMIRREQVAGFNISRHSQSIGLGHPDISATLVKSYNGKDFNGFVYILKATDSSRYFDIDLKALAIGQPNLAILAQVDRSRIGGPKAEERETALRIVAKPGASSYRVILPVSITREK